MPESSRIARLFYLSGKHSQLIIRQSLQFEVLYWGARLPESMEVEWAHCDDMVPNGRLDTRVPISLSPCQGEGNFGAPGIEGHRAGRAWSPVWQPQAITPLSGENGLRLRMTDPQAGLQLDTCLQLDPLTDVLQMQQQLTNLGKDHYQLQRLALTLPLPRQASELMCFHGRWIHEFQTSRQSITHGGYHQENRRGRTSHEYFPGLIQGMPGFSEQRGEVYGLHLAWSGNHRFRSDIKTDGRRYLQAEALYYPGEINLAPGETVSSPWLYGSFSACGTNRMSQQFHQYVRQQLLHFPEAKPRPVHLNTWEGIYFDHDPAYLLQMAEQAASLGIERFILDDGWFVGRRNDRAGLGDWRVDPVVYPEGLHPLCTKVNALGMEFGLWFEPEMINPDSQLFRQHPDWILAEPGYDQPLGRHQYLLDLQRPEAFAYVLDSLDSLLQQYPIRYVKWDMNREVVQPGHQGRAGQHNQVLTLYRLLDALRERHPQVEFESCASGGGRADYAMLRYCQRIWTSDNNDALERQSIQRGFSYFFPPEVMGAHIGHAVAHNSRRQHSLEFRALTALFGHLGIELDPVRSSAEERSGYQHFIALHKQLRSRLHQGRYYRLETDDPAQQADMVLSDDGQSALLRLFQLGMLTYAMPGRLKIPGLNADARYQISLLHRPACLECYTMGRAPEWTRQLIRVSGDWLGHIGLLLPNLDPESGLLLDIQQRA